MPRRTAPAPIARANGRRRGPGKGDLKEAAILDTAWALLGQKPLSAITIEDLAAGAGLSRSTFYFYFDSREAVMPALAARVADEIRDVFSQARGGATVPDLRNGIAAYLRRWQDKGSVLRAMSTLSETDDTLRDFWERVSGELLDEAATSLDQLRRDGLALPAPPASADLVRVLFAMLWRTGYELSLKPPHRAEEQRIIDALTTVFLRACVGTASG